MSKKSGRLVALDSREARFIDEYLLDPDAYSAALKAGYSETVARSRSSSWVGPSRQKQAKPHVYQELKRRQAILAEKFSVTQEKVLQELAKLGFSNLADFTRLVGEDRIIDLSEATRDQLAALAEITVEDYKDGRGEDARDVRKVKIRLQDKMTALTTLAKHLGLFDGHEPTLVVNNDNRSITINSTTPQEAAKEYQKLISGG
jgi:phage terminase small subunit